MSNSAVFPLSLVRSMLKKTTQGCTGKFHSGKFNNPSIVNQPAAKFVSIAGGTPSRVVCLTAEKGIFNVSSSVYIMPSGEFVYPG